MKKQEQQLRAYILKTLPTGEADEIITVFSLERGKMRLSASGVRKITSKLRHALVAPSESSLRIVEGNVFAKVIGASVISRVDLPLTQDELIPWYWLVEIVSQGMVDDHPNTAVYELFGLVLNLLSSLGQKPAGFSWVLSCWITLRWLEANGWSLTLPDVPSGWRMSDGRFVVSDDLSKKLIPENISAVILKIAQLEIDELENSFLGTDAEHAKRTHVVLADVATFYTDRKWKTVPS